MKSHCNVSVVVLKNITVLQESFELVKEEGGSLLFVAGPSPALSSPSSCPAPSLYPGLQDNQAFLATKDLRILAQQVLFFFFRFYHTHLIKIGIRLDKKSSS